MVGRSGAERAGQGWGSGLALRYGKTRPDPADVSVTPRTCLAKQDLSPVPACMHGRVRGSPDPDLPNTKCPASRQAQPGGGDFWSAEERSSRVGARSALRHHSGRGCPNEAPAGRVVSSAARPSGEHRRAVGAFSARPLQVEPPPGCACRDARQRQRPCQRQRQRQRRPGNDRPQRAENGHWSGGAGRHAIAPPLQACNCKRSAAHSVWVMTRTTALRCVSLVRWPCASKAWPAWPSE